MIIESFCFFLQKIFMPATKISISVPTFSGLSPSTIILAADIGGTKTDLALFEVKEEKFTIIKERVYHSKDWHTFADMTRDFNGSLPPPERLCVAVAGPVENGRAKMTNLDWTLDREQLQAELGINHVLLINDLEAKAYGLATLTEEDFQMVYPGKRYAKGNAAIIAPGTGLGEAGLFWDGKALHPFATEGGHSDFAPRTDLDIELFRFLRQQFGHVSWERLVSGPGILNIYQFLRDVKGREEPSALHAKFNRSDPAQVIGESVEEFPICKEAIELFIKYLAIESSSLALKFKATGGVFIGGGIIPKIWTEALQAVFLEHFFEVGRLRSLVEAMPVHIILNTKAALLGAAYYGCH